MLEIGRTVQRAFGSWSEMLDNYRAGRDFWMAREGLDEKRVGNILDVTRSLLRKADSPLRRIPWERPLVG